MSADHSPSVSNSALSINLTTPSPKKPLQPKTPKTTQQAASVKAGGKPNVSVQNTPTKQTSSSVLKAQKARNGSGTSVFASNASQSPQGGAGNRLKMQNVALLSDSPTHSLMLNNSVNDSDAPFSVWGGDDMTLEMITDVNDREVDEDVSASDLTNV